MKPSFRAATLVSAITSAQGTSRLVWSIALPAMLTNVATALFGLADMWVIGRLGDAPAQGAVELGAKFMLGLFTIFNFLRTGTIALTAQSAGRGDTKEQAEALARGIGAALLIGLLLMLLKPIAVGSGLAMLEAKGAVAAHAQVYVGIRYWAGIAWLLNCVLVGWLIGQRRVRSVLVIEIAANAAHIALDLAFVLLLGWGVAGLALATVSSEVLKLLMLAALLGFQPAARKAAACFLQRATWNAQALRQLFALNRDLLFRTILLTWVMLIFARSGAQQGPVILAANGILFQLFMLSSLVLDGFESAAQVLCGEAMGRRDRAHFLAVLRGNMLWGVLTGIVISLAYMAAGDLLASTFNTDPAVIRTAHAYAVWIAALPLLGVTSFVLDGVFVGAAWTRAMLVTMIVAISAYVALLFLLTPLGNHGLWLAYGLFFIARAAGQLYMLPGLVRRDLGPAS